jgi:lycopene cyclase domain-containing protein
LSHLTYVALLAACLLATAPLELFLRVRVYARWLQLVSTVVPVCAVFVAWDLLAVHLGWWSYDRHYLLGPTLPGRLPMEELLFFLVVPACAVLTYEAVLARRPLWR